MRTPASNPEHPVAIAIALSVAGVGMLAVSSWLEIHLLRLHGEQ